MENKAHALAAGLFTLLLGSAVLYAAMWLTRDTIQRESYVLESRYAVTGLGVQASVRLRGVEVGKVESIEFDTKNRQFILIGISVKAGTPITRGTSARLESQGLTGIAYVMLDDDGSQPQPLSASGEERRRIPVRQTFFDELSVSGRDLLTQLSQVSLLIEKLLKEENQTQLMGAVASLEVAARSFASLSRTIEVAARNVPALTADARKVLQRAEGALGSVDALARQLAQHADTLDRVARSAEEMGINAGRAGSAVQSVSGTLVGETLPRINGLIEDLAQTSRRLDRLLEELNERPHGLVFGKPPGAPGPGEPGFNQPRSATQK